MIDKERRASKYLPFEALKGLKSVIEEENEKVKRSEYQCLSEDQKEELDFKLFECYSQNKPVVISYFQNGYYQKYSGVITKIDILNRQIIIMPKKRFNIDNINDIEIK